MGKKLYTLFGLLVGINVLCAIGFFWGKSREATLSEQANVLHTAMVHVEEVKDVFEEHFSFLQGKVMQTSLHQSTFILGKEHLDTREIDRKLRLSKSENPAIIQDIAKVNSILEDLDKTKKELYRAISDTLIADRAALHKVNAIFSNKLIPQRAEVLHNLVEIHNAHQKDWQEIQDKIESANTLQGISIAASIVLTLVCLFFAFQTVQQGFVLPLQSLIRALAKNLPPPVEDSEIGLVAGHINNLQKELNETQKVVQSLSQGQFDKPIDANAVNEQMQSHLSGLKKRFQQVSDDLFVKDNELKSAQTKAKSLEHNLDEISVFYQNRMQVVMDTFHSCEISLLGNVLSVNDKLLELIKIDKNAIRDKKIFDLFKQDADNIWEALTSGSSWQGIVSVENKKSPQWLYLSAFPLKNLHQETEKYVLAGFDFTEWKEGNLRLTVDNDEMKKKLTQLSKELSDMQVQFNTSQAEMEILQSIYEKQKSLEQRLILQQQALLNLTRHPDLKAGNIRESLRLVTEMMVQTLGEERSSLWLLTQGGERLHCLDIYAKSSQEHSNSVEISQSEVPDIFELLSNEEVIAVANVKSNQQTEAFGAKYLQPNQIKSFISAPIHLGGSVIGMLMVEHISDSDTRDWNLDEQNFVISSAEIVSLALEQGNRKVMEEELRVTLEESQALDEELRQNAEEIEATNEEMRRTQIELRGHINALNNAAIVSEGNLQGLITYANNEFLTTYKYEKKQVLGKNHNLLKSDEHDAEFFKSMWDTILSGQVWNGEVKNKASDANFIWVSLTITPVLGLDGLPFKFIAVSFNITRQKLQSQRIKEALQTALEQEELLRTSASTLLETNEEMRKTQLELTGQIQALNTSSLVIETDIRGVVLKVNDAFQQISQFQPAELVDLNFTGLKSSRMPDTLFTDLWRTVSDGGTWRSEIELMTKKANENFWVVITSNPVFDEHGEPIKVIHVMFDITEQKQQEFRLKKQQSALLEINSHPSVKEGNIKKAFQIIAKVGMETLRVTRASIWLFIENGRKVRCTSIYQKDNHEHAEGTILDTEMYPTYFRTLERDRLIDAGDAINDSRTKELAFTLFKPLGIQSVMDVGIRQGDRNLGILSFEFTEHVREWTLDEQAFATSLADTVALVMEQKERQLNTKLKQAYAQLEEANKEMIRQKQEIEETTQGLAQSIKYAKRIQTNILPAKEIMDRIIGKDNYFVVHRQRDQVGGDFYWFDQIGTKQVFVIGDGTGHGVPGAFLTLIGYLLLNQIVVEKQITSPSEILYYLHKGVRTALKQEEDEGKKASRDGMDVAVATFDSATNTAEYAGANLPFYYYKDWEIHEIKPTKKSIGGEQLEEERLFQNHSIQLKPGDAFYMYTDGFVDQFGGPEEKRFSTKRFRDLILRTQNESMSTQRAMLNMEWKDWKEDREQLDDVTVFGYKVGGNENHED